MLHNKSFGIVITRCADRIGSGQYARIGVHTTCQSHPFGWQYI